MKKILCFTLFIQLTVCIYSQWYVQTVVTQNDLFAIKFIDSVNAYAVGDNETIIKTTNAGENWLIQHENSTYALFAIDFIDDNTGFAVGGIWSPSSGIIFRTTNSGENWFGTTVDSVCFMSIHFINSNIGVAGGWGNSPSLLYLTTNSGINWNRQIINNVTEVSDISFFDANTGWGAGWSFSGEKVIKSTNGGINWSLIWTGGIYDLYSLFFINANTGWMTGDRFISKTTDGGYNWFYQIIPYTGFPELYKSYFINENTGWVSGDAGTILKTTNGGENWGRQTTSFNEWIWDIYLPNENTGWAVGGSGTILKTTNSGGPIGVKKINSTVPDSYVLFQNYPNPFNPVTKIKFSLPSPSKGGVLKVKLIIYDMLGRKVANLIPPLWGGQEGFAPGTYSVDWDGTNYPSGVYFYKLETDGYSETKKMVLIK